MHFFTYIAHPRDPHSFPTRRSSDLAALAKDVKLFADALLATAKAKEPRIILAGMMRGSFAFAVARSASAKSFTSFASAARSEERRVGKECGSRGWAI